MSTAPTPQPLASASKIMAVRNQKGPTLGVMTSMSLVAEKPVVVFLTAEKYFSSRNQIEVCILCHSL